MFYLRYEYVEINKSMLIPCQEKINQRIEEVWKE